MAIVVEHEKRKHEILEKSLDIFTEDGYEDVTFQKIADRCGITRTTLYIYFKNKREIFLWSIKQLTGALEIELRAIVENKTLTSEECLRQILFKIISECEENYKLFGVLLSYLMQVKKSGQNPGDRIKRRVLRLRHLLSTVIIRGIDEGEFKKQAVKDVDEMFYGMIESAIFRLSVLGEKECTDIRRTLTLAVDMLVIPGKVDSSH